jgi:hypothetical protein
MRIVAIAVSGFVLLTVLPEAARAVEPSSPAGAEPPGAPTVEPTEPGEPEPSAMPAEPPSTGPGEAGSEGPTTSTAAREGHPAAETSKGGTSAVPAEFITEEPPEPAPEPLPPGTDTVSGHLLIGVSGAFILPFGSLEEGTAQGDVFSSGSAFGIDVGFGISRTTFFGLAGQFALLGADSDCPTGCEATSFGVGPFIRYHLVQGLSFDPWLSAGIGFRQTSRDGGPSYTGFDFARLAIGGDWYPFSNLGIGPVLDLTLSTFVSRSEGDFAGASVAGTFSAGGRIVFDTPGK